GCDGGAGTVFRENAESREFLPSGCESIEAGESSDSVERLEPLPPPQSKRMEGRNEKSVAGDFGGAGLQGEITGATKANSRRAVNENSFGFLATKVAGESVKSGTIALPLLGSRQMTHQRAFLK